MHGQRSGDAPREKTTTAPIVADEAAVAPILVSRRPKRGQAGIPSARDDQRETQDTPMSEAELAWEEERVPRVARGRAAAEAEGSIVVSAPRTVTSMPSSSGKASSAATAGGAPQTEEPAQPKQRAKRGYGMYVAESLVTEFGRTPGCRRCEDNKR